MNFFKGLYGTINLDFQKKNTLTSYVTSTTSLTLVTGFAFVLLNLTLQFFLNKFTYFKFSFRVLNSVKGNINDAKTMLKPKIILNETKSNVKK